jgi:hypothetical protein
MENINMEKMNVPLMPSNILRVLTPSLRSASCWYICVRGYMVAIKKDDAMAEYITDRLENKSLEDNARILAQNIHAP